MKSTLGTLGLAACISAIAVAWVASATPCPAHCVPPANVPHKPDTTHNLDVKADGDSVAIGAWSLTTRENDCHVSVCFETDTANEFSSTADCSGEHFAFSTGTATPKDCANWTLCQVLAVFTKDGEPVYYTEQEITR
jgi:hypothetical protein